MSPSKIKLLPFTIIVSTASLAIILSTPAQSQGGAKSMLMVQGATPGISQSGHANISGTMRAGAFAGGPGSFSGFTSIGRTSGQVSGNESFGIGENATTFDGMYIKTATSGKPFYGYSTSGPLAYHYYNGAAGLWVLSINGVDQLQVSQFGVGIGTTPAPGYSLNLTKPVNYASSTNVEDAFEISMYGNDSRGGEAISYGSNGIGFLGRASHEGGYGLYGDNVGSAGGTAVLGFGWGSTSTGVKALGGSYGVDGYSQFGYAIHGKSETSHGVIGFSNVEAVVGVTTGANKAASHGYTSVAGSDGGWFVSAATTGDGVGVIGSTGSGAGYGVQSFGRFMSTGTKAFRIDHPLEPETKFLSHYCSEGPEPMNVYSGAITTGTDGFASVELPDYFASINRDPRIQLTVDDSGEDFVMVKVVGGIQDNAFRVRTSKPGVKVYWQVSGVRNDKYMQRYGAPVEIEKSPTEVGRYQHPELYDAEPSQGLRVQPQAEKYQAQARAEKPLPQRLPLPKSSRVTSTKK